MSRINFGSSSYALGAAHSFTFFLTYILFYSYMYSVRNREDRAYLGMDISQFGFS